MSTTLAMDFGNEYGNEYAKVVDKWSEKLEGVEEVTPQMEKDFSSDVTKALGAAAITTMVAGGAAAWAVSNLPLPSVETLTNFAKIAVKSAMGAMVTKDLLRRLRDRVNASNSDKENHVFETPGATAARAPQTVSQILDMVRDVFNRLIGRHFQSNNQLTGRRRWRTVGAKSRHKQLHGQIKDDGENFEFKGESIYGPRPPLGAPANWSNCSCVLEVEKTNGDWVRIK